MRPRLEGNVVPHLVHDSFVAGVKKKTEKGLYGQKTHAGPGMCFLEGVIDQHNGPLWASVKPSLMAFMTSFGTRLLIS
jgi:hypothetical protein